MNTLRQAVQEYLAMRRSLGFKLQSAGRALFDFVSFLEQHRASYITLRLALAWAKQPSGGQSEAPPTRGLRFPLRGCCRSDPTARDPTCTLTRRFSSYYVPRSTGHCRHATASAAHYCRGFTIVCSGCSAFRVYGWVKHVISGFRMSI
jgi:hypothetical protein